MANQITFQIKIETLGEENVKKVTMDAEELGPSRCSELKDAKNTLATKRSKSARLWSAWNP